MTGKDGLESGRFIDLLLEVEDADHQVKGTCHFRNAPSVPSPDLRADVVDDAGWNLFFPDRLGKTNVKPGVIDEDDRFGWVSSQFVEECCEFFFEIAVVSKHIPEAENACLRDPVVHGAS